LLIRPKPALGFVAGALAGMLMSSLFAWLTLVLTTNQVATGLALSIFGAGLSAFIGQSFVGQSLPAGAHGIPFLSELPFLGKALFDQHWAVYFSLLLCARHHLVLISHPRRAGVARSR
jgi:simple sugar transport system permease protein